MEIAAAGKGLCFRCGGQGRRAAYCATPPAPKGKGKGEQGKGKGEGFGEKVKGKSAGKGGARQQCPHCGKVGHGASTCWTLHTEQLPWKRTSGLDFEGDPTERDMGLVDIARGEVRRAVRRPELGFDRGAEDSCKSRRMRSWGRGGVVGVPPGIELSNSFAALVCDASDVGEKNCFEIAPIEQ